MEKGLFSVAVFGTQSPCGKVLTSMLDAENIWPRCPVVSAHCQIYDPAISDPPALVQPARIRKNIHPSDRTLINILKHYYFFKLVSFLGGLLHNNR